MKILKFNLPNQGRVLNEPFHSSIVSKTQKRLGILFILLSLLFQSGSVIFGKFASITITGHNPLSLLINPYYILTILCLFLQAITWQQTLRYHPLAWSYMFMSGIYPVIMLSSYLLFGEHISVQNIFGAIIIFIGVVNLMFTKR